MAKVFIDDTTLTNIGNAIRSVNGSPDLILPSTMPDVIKTLGNGLYVWKKYNVEFVQGTATTVTLQNDGTSINLYTIDNLYLKDDLTVGIQGDVAKTVAISSLLENTVLGGMNPIYYAYGEDGFVYAYSRCSSDGTAITISNPVTAEKGEFINYVVSDNSNAFPDGDVHNDGFFYEVFDGSWAYVWKKYQVTNATINITQITASTANPSILQLSSNEIDFTTFDFARLIGLNTIYSNETYSYIIKFSSTSSVLLDGNSYSMSWNAETAQMTINVTLGASFTFTPIEETFYDFIDYVVSYTESAYPDGGTQGGYWYELYNKTITPEMFGCTKMMVDKFTYSSDADMSTTINHSLGENPKFAFAIPKTITLRNYMLSAVIGMSISSSAVLFKYYYTNGGNAYNYVESKNSAMTTTTTTVKFNNATSSFKFAAGVEYTLVTMA